MVGGVKEVSVTACEMVSKSMSRVDAEFRSEMRERHSDFVDGELQRRCVRYVVKESSVESRV